ncbi:Dol-P-Glc:Glc(2)Man(9)GlcNAc(2)-PP-Dol alpha-1,2-glucosyltransferase [Fusarium keratoplasticum]|uniref:Dol-P-Glc:Glc(2)Man(9)GlcNAc(2)-PP-Dol alpha-1,2-glucosyltransferase n=1 Tax=Fusarium keratoplasticum TaxID=1328300 RepID=A0ACC0RAD2_9HYPO|nr:Dol-P-Glc:Glc(2)Man(9)GlcNAc(2)-PP-Dol alpha-1,2-glucosyltransferase [Fusarium keratoplasticum]KAI8679471.1 Dol-P-Glc:Glc(2)Man(9)GlcNAc(2)-PP-Dol alpha-1,2-glucosyltransferase [Fusarium keratoplasticum]
MEPQSLSFWTASSGLVVLPVFFCVLSKSKGTLTWLAGLLPFVLAALCFSWLYIVSAIVPEPYLDEVFHIPQAQKYCEGKFLEWDDKITTPPGLYLLSLLIPGVVRPNGSLGGYVCDASSLRATNAIALMFLTYLALQCRHQIECRLYEAHSSIRLRVHSQYALHTAFNIALFPLLFFFSGLYYTDVASTAAVLVAYLNHLNRLGRDQSSPLNDILTVVLGVFTLFFRQTNVFWVVVYMGGLEAVHAIKTLRPERVDQPFMSSLVEQVKYYLWRYSLGDIHDPPLNLLWPDEVIFCVLSLGIAALCNPIRVIRQIWPYVAVLAAFGSFVFWNGGVVLGDKSNHVATIHLPQMLYIWPFFGFFSLPLLVPCALPFINALIRVIPRKSPSSTATPAVGTGRVGKGSKSRSSGSSKIKTPTRASGTGAPDTTPPALSAPLQMADFIFNSKILWPIYILATILLSIAVVRYNTIIHPFTLADNRHYMFYIFRYTIRRASWIRYALIVPYTVARWMTWDVMAGCSPMFFIGSRNTCSFRYMVSDEAPFMSNPFWIRRGASARQTDAPFPAAIEETSPGARAEERELNQALEDDPLLASVEPACTSTGLIFLLATTLSLMTAPLVEPRYFIIPWVMWRLLLPAWRLHNHEPNGLVGMLMLSKLRPVVMAFRHYDVRLILETGWFIAINVVTGYIFLCKPYLWKAEDGTLLDEGRLQRFMW